MQLHAQKTLARAPVAQRARCVRVCAVQKQQNASSPVAFVAAAVAAGVISCSGPALAGVVLEQPQLKKVFQADETAAPAVPSAIGKGPGSRSAKPAAAAAPKKKEAVAETSSGGLAPQTVALPAALVVVGGGAFALSSLDAGFSEFMRTAAVKDSSADGAGYETDLKGDGPVGGKKRAGGSKAKKAGTGTLSLFGK